MKKAISIAAALALLAAGSGITAANAAGMENSAAVAGAYEITADMIFGIDDSSISAEWIAENIYTYDNITDDTDLSKLAAACTAVYTIDIGEEQPVIFGTYRAFIAGSSGDTARGVTIYGSNDDISYTEIGKAAQLECGEWNDITLRADAAYRYIKVEADKENMVYTESSGGVETTGGSSEDESDGDSELAEATAAPETGGAETARTVKAVFIETQVSDDDTSTGATQIGGGVGASGALGFFGSKFPDCRGHWAEEIIVECTDRNLLDGYDDGNFYPDNPVTAAEFSKLYSAWQSTFYIVNDGYWAMPYIRDMLDKGIFENSDYSDYGAYMTREMCAKAIINSLTGEYFPSELEQFRQYITDIDSADEGCADYVLKAYISGIMSGYDDGSFDPKGYVTRAEILTIINRAMNEDQRAIPETVAGISTEAAETQTYYTAAVQVRKSTSANSMNFRLYGANSKYMTEDDPGSGLKLYDEFQGAQGMAFLMRFDLSDIIEREDSLTSIKFIINRHSNGEIPIGLFWYEYKLSTLDWNQSGYSQVVNNSAVAGEDKSLYNSVVDNISAILPTWGDIDGAVPQEEKVQPFAQAELKDNQYVFELSLDELKAHMNEDNIVEFFATTVNYDRYGMEKDNKPRCYTAGELAPQIYCTFDTGESES